MSEHCKSLAICLSGCNARVFSRLLQSIHYMRSSVSCHVLSRFSFSPTACNCMPSTMRQKQKCKQQTTNLSTASQTICCFSPWKLKKRCKHHCRSLTDKTNEARVENKIVAMIAVFIFKNWHFEFFSLHFNARSTSPKLDYWLTDWLVGMGSMPSPTSVNVDETKEMQNKINLVSVFPVHKSHKKSTTPTTRHGLTRTSKKCSHTHS